MNKKLLTISAVFILIAIALLPSNSTAESNDYDAKNSVLKLKSIVDITLDKTKADEPIMPGSEPKAFTINATYQTVNYKTGLGKILNNFFFKLLKGKEKVIKLDIIDKPDWCIATLSDTQHFAFVSDEKQNFSTELYVEVLKNSTAYEHGAIKINVSVEPQKGPLGKLLIIAGYQDTFLIEIIPAYYPDIDTKVVYENCTDTEIIEISPYNETAVPINITNQGNSETKVLVEITKAPENWTVEVDPSVTIDMDSTKQIQLLINATHKFENETISLKLTPARADEDTDVGESTNITIKLHNDGSYKEPEEPFEIDTTLLAIIILALVILTILIVIIRRRR